VGIEFALAKGKMEHKQSEVSMRAKMMSFLTVVITVLGLAACNNKTTTQTAETPVAAPAPITPWTGQEVPPANNDYLYSVGDTLTFKPTDFSIFNTYVAVRPLNNPSNYKINIQLQHVGGLRYGGKVTISYNDNGQTYSGTLESGLGINQKYDISSHNDGEYEAHYNYWYNGPNGLPVYTGFFQDRIGAIILVIESYTVSNQGDGQAAQVAARGSVWFKNFATSMAQQGYMRKCWFITLGPYDCRSDSIIRKTSSTPTDGYRLLGTFTGIDTKKAFGL
jgi:hypothetical protein